MAEESSELNEGTQIRVSRTDTFDNTNADESTDSETRSIENLSDSEESNINTDVTSDETSDETEELRSQIEDTRSQMSETIDAIQEKLSFSNISEQVKDEVSEHINSAIQTAKESVYGATLGKVGNIMNFVNKGMNEFAEADVMRSAKKNPLAISLIGLGFGMLLMNGYSKKSKSYRYTSNYDSDRTGGFRTGEFSGNENQSMMSSAQDRISNARDAIGGTVSSAAGAVSGTVSDAAGAVSGTVSGVASKAYEQVGNFGSQARDLAGTAQDQYEYYIEENPLAVGAVALAIGAAVGMSIPSTRFEGELMGETRDNLLQKAQDTARDTIGKVQKVAGSVTETVKQAAGDLAQNVKDSAGDVTQTVKDEAQKQGLT